MIIDANGNGSFLFQSLQANDASLYTWDQSEENLGFIAVTLLNVQGNVQANNFNGNNANLTANVTANNIIVNNLILGGTTVQPPTVTILTGNANNLVSQTGIYSPPAGCVWFKVRMVGGGGGGAAWNSAGVSANGTNSVFGNTSQGPAVTCAFGQLGASIAGGPGGNTSTIGTGGNSGWTVIGANGAAGQGSFSPDSTSYSMGGSGGGSPFGGSGAGGGHTLGGFGAITRTGSGGGGAGGEPSVPGGGGGGAGAYAEIYVTIVANSYPYTIGAAGIAGTVGNPVGNNGTEGGTGSGGNGGQGIIIIEEHYIG
jgi:hypothetical protein